MGSAPEREGRRVKMVARALLVACLLFSLYPPLLVLMRWEDIGPGLHVGGPFGMLAFALSLQSFAIVGYVVAVRRPTNPIGWLMIALGLYLPLQLPALRLAELLRPIPVAGGAAAVLYAILGLAWVAFVVLLMILLFPSGRLPARAWRIALWPLALLTVVDSVLRVLATPGPTTSPNPLFVEDLQAEGIAPLWSLAMRPPTILAAVLLVGGLAILLTPLWRWWRAAGSERAQLKWIALAAILSLGLVFVAPARPAYGVYLAIALFPAAIGIAILRARLFDIDFVINRGALYGTVAFILAGAFELLAFASEQLFAPPLREQLAPFRPLLAVAVLPAFSPLRRAVRPLADRFLPANERLALLFTDIVGSTDILSAVGDARWRELLARYYGRIRDELREHRGTEVHITGDGLFAMFREPLDAARCALAIVPATGELGLRTRVGLHVGDCDMRGEEPAGINVHLAARVMSVADGDAVVVSESCRDALSAAELTFEPLGPRHLKGIPGEVYLYRLGLDALKRSSARGTHPDVSRARPSGTTPIASEVAPR